MLFSTTPAVGMMNGAHHGVPARGSNNLEIARSMAKSKDAVKEEAASKRHGRLLSPLEEEESTEAPSSAFCSDAESSSGAEGGSDSCAADDETQCAPGLRQGPPSVRTLTDHKSRQRLTAAARLKPRSRRMAFGGTPLDPIPGTPVGMSEHPPLFFPVPTPSDDQEPGEEEAALLTGPLLPKALLSTAPQQSIQASLPPGLWLPTSPKRRARAALMEKAKQEGTPIKVSMQSDTEMSTMKKRTLDPFMPAKKRPIFSEKIELLRAVEPGMPVKKRVTPWIVAEPVRVLPAAPR